MGQKLTVFRHKIDMCNPSKRWLTLIKIIGLSGTCPIPAVSILYKVRSALVKILAFPGGNLHRHQSHCGTSICPPFAANGQKRIRY